ncbi:MAG TPA: redoxin domain-containing protein [Dissulfurispiraceae bacterium]|nr:redoxin domain-containing protein [Dissulfurispiraceae bacterium]
MSDKRGDIMLKVASGPAEGSLKGYLYLLLLAGSLALLVGLFHGCSDQKVVLRVGQTAPAFSLADIDGKTWKFPEDLKGKVVAIRFWADWCKSCAEEMPVIEKTYDKYKDQGLVILAVNIGQERDAVVKFINGIKISYTVLLDPGTLVTKRYGVTGLPITFIIDRNGIIKQKILGEAGQTAFEEIVLGQLRK